MNIKEFLKEVESDELICKNANECIEFLKTHEWEEYFTTVFPNESADAQEDVMMFIMDNCYNLSDNTPENKMVEKILADQRLMQSRNKIFNDDQERDRQERISKDKAIKKLKRKHKLKQIELGKSFIEVSAKYPLTLQVENDLKDEINDKKNAEISKLIFNSLKTYKEFDNTINKYTIILHLFSPLIEGCKVLTCDGDVPIDGIYETVSHYDIIEDDYPVQISTMYPNYELTIENGIIIKHDKLKTINDYKIGINYINKDGN